MLPNFPISTSTSLVVWDLETTGLNGDAEIVHLTATAGDKKFAMNVLPSINISPCVTDVTGLSVPI